MEKTRHLLGDRFMYVFAHINCRVGPTAFVSLYMQPLSVDTAEGVAIGPVECLSWHSWPLHERLLNVLRFHMPKAMAAAL